MILTYSEWITESMIFTVVNYKRCSFWQLDQTTDFLSELVSRRTNLKLISNIQILLCIFREEFFRLEYFNNIFCIGCALSEVNSFVSGAILLWDCLKCYYFLTPLISALVLELVNRKRIIKLMGQHKHWCDWWRLFWAFSLPRLNLFAFLARLFWFLTNLLLLKLLQRCNLLLHLIIVDTFDIGVPSNRESLVFIEKPISALLFSL